MKHIKERSFNKSNQAPLHIASKYRVSGASVASQVLVAIKLF